MHTTIHQRFSVPFQYPVHFTENLFDGESRLFSDLVRSCHTPKVFFVIDEGVAKAWPNLISDIRHYAIRHRDAFSLCAEPLIVPGGEAAKNNRQCLETILQATERHAIDRHSYLVAIGGGAVLDMVGFAAAIAHRGIRHIRIPTTVLAQNDSGVGVKNGINAYDKKNYLGTFAPPYAVINDAVFLQTLDERDWRAGMAEALKVALIKDAGFFRWMEENAVRLAARQMEPMQQLIHRCAELHLQHIAGGDPFECGSSRPLDFGHWSAHKLEQLTDYQLRHGEAVAIGIALDATYSYLSGRISNLTLERIVTLIKTLGFDIYVPELEGDAVLKGLEEFREHLGGRLTLMLLHEIGQGVEVHAMDTALILCAINKLKRFDAAPYSSALPQVGHVMQTGAAA